jgi:cell division protein ZapA
MPDVTVQIGGHSYTIACREGEEAHLSGIAAIVDQKAAQAREAVGGVNEVRQLLFASLLLADELDEAQKGLPAATVAPRPVQTAISDPAITEMLAETLEHLAARIETLAGKLENSRQSA